MVEAAENRRQDSASGNCRQIVDEGGADIAMILLTVSDTVDLRGAEDAVLMIVSERAGLFEVRGREGIEERFVVDRLHVDVVENLRRVSSEARRSRLKGSWKAHVPLE